MKRAHSLALGARVSWGLFELAHGGSVFLDEIDALPIELQGRLLRVLQEKEVLRVGGETIIPVNIRVIAAANKPPHELVSQGKLREDLYYRLNVLYLEIPSLKDRLEDIPLLCRYFLSFLKFGDTATLLEELKPYMLRYAWPGNVRELYNFCQRLSFYRENIMQHTGIEKLLRKIAPDMLSSMSSAENPCLLGAQIRAYESRLIEEAVREAGSLRKAAEKLGVPKSTLSRKAKQKRPNNGPERPEFGDETLRVFKRKTRSNEGFLLLIVSQPAFAELKELQWIAAERRGIPRAAAESFLTGHVYNLAMNFLEKMQGGNPKIRASSLQEERTGGGGLNRLASFMKGRR